MPNAPAIPAADLALLQTVPQKSKLYLVIQQAQYRDPETDEWTGYDWSGRVEADVGVADPITKLTVNSAKAVQLLDGMTVLIGSTAHGTWDRGIVRLHGDQNITAAAGETLYIATSSDLRNVKRDDYVVVLDEFRFWARYPKVTNGAGLTWYKDYGTFRDRAIDPGLLWTNLGANAAARRQASMPPVPVMGPHAVKFIPKGGAVTIDFNWTDSYTMAPGEALAWGGANPNNSWGETDHLGGRWASNAQNPGAQNYTIISGLAGFRVWLELNNVTLNPIVEFRRGVRYVFTLRRPGQTQRGDPPNAEPIVDFSISGMQGSFDTGYWRASITVYDAQASEWCILPGALVIVFADDTYGSTTGSIGPLDNPGLTAPMDDRDNIVLIGRIADGTITVDSETGDVSFDIISLAQQASDRENYPVPIENDDNSEEWYGTPDLTVDRAAWFYWAWHTTGPLIADFYQVGGADGAIEIAAQDFLAGDIYQSAIGSFLQDRRFSHILFDRYERAICEVNVAIGGLPPAALFTRLDADTLEETVTREVVEIPCSLVEAGGVSYVAGVVTPYLSKAPGEVSKYLGRPTQSTHLAVANQADLDTLSGQLLAYLNNTYPDFVLKLAGNWRVFDIAPQAYLDCGVLATPRRTFTNVNLIVRSVAFDYDPEAGALFTTVHAEADTTGPDGVTVTIPDSVPTDSPAAMRTAPAGIPGDDGWGGVMIAGSEKGVHWANFLDTPPVWTEINTGLPAGEEQCWKLFKDDHCWTPGGTKRLWGIFGTESQYLYAMDFPDGEWELKFDVCEMAWGYADHPRLVEASCSWAATDHMHLIAGQYSGGGLLWIWDAFRSTDSGEHWQKRGYIADGNYDDNFPVLYTSLCPSPTIAANAYALIDNFSAPPNLFFSADSGDTWTDLGELGTMPTSRNSRSLLVPYASADKYIYGHSIYVDDSIKRVQRSANLGGSWQQAGWNDSTHPYGASADPDNPLKIACLFTAGGQWDNCFVMVSTNGGATWAGFDAPGSDGNLATYSAANVAQPRFCPHLHWHEGELDAIVVHSKKDSHVLYVQRNRATGAYVGKEVGAGLVAAGVTYTTTFVRDATPTVNGDVFK